MLDYCSQADEVIFIVILKLLLLFRDLLKLIFDPLLESYEKSFGLPIQHWMIMTKVVRLLWINTIPKELFYDT